MTITIAIVQSRVNRRWSYCPEGTPLVRVCEYTDGQFRSRAGARAAARADNTVPKDATFKDFPIDDYQPKTGARCGCRRGVQRDNCPACEGTGWLIDFRRTGGRA